MLLAALAAGEEVWRLGSHRLRALTPPVAGGVGPDLMELRAAVLALE